MTLQPWQLT